ncbi:hypothetical protein [Agilicoccus flavus]|uniref:hypothetical protein n=1 Tax=Agilicoccus flavus TaxID=2775968 RepID=UPI001CF6A562|nr:hypothetical protein [Agilicoccus flavus]
MSRPRAVPAGTPPHPCARTASPAGGGDRAALSPSDYPWWTLPGRPGVLREGRFVPGPVTPPRDPDLRAVVAVGSNASPEVLAAKLPADGPAVVVAPGRLQGLGVGHSAHVSLRGYVAAAPYRDPHAVSDVVVAWLDAAGLAALDATEPNYDRLPLPGGARLVVAGAEIAAAELYVSRHGVVDLGGGPAALGPQAAILTALAGVPTLTHLVGGSPADAARRLAADPRARERVRAALADGGLARAWTTETGRDAGRPGP